MGAKEGCILLKQTLKSAWFETNVKVGMVLNKRQSRHGLFFAILLV